MQTLTDESISEVMPYFHTDLTGDSTDADCTFEISRIKRGTTSRHGEQTQTKVPRQLREHSSNSSNNSSALSRTS